MSHLAVTPPPLKSETGFLKKKYLVFNEYLAYTDHVRDFETNLIFPPQKKKKKNLENF